jgi:hypothetical protein
MNAGLGRHYAIIDTCDGHARLPDNAPLLRSVPRASVLPLDIRVQCYPEVLSIAIAIDG